MLAANSYEDKLEGVAYVHDWIVNLGGAEKVLESMISEIPGDIFTLFFDKESVQNHPNFSKCRITPSFLQKFPFITRIYRNLLPLFPKAVESLNVKSYKVIVSSSHAVAKGIKKKKGQIHVCYCHTPMRYIWDLYEDYLHGLPKFKRPFFKLTTHYLRKWDIETNKNVDIFIANSRFVAERIKRIYNREAIVIYPPVNLEQFPLYKGKKEDFFIFVGRLVNIYKRVDLVIKAFNKLKLKLIVVGDGPDKPYLQSIAESNIEFVGWKKGKELTNLMQKARALIIPSVDDFGIVAVEAQACGTPVIAYKKGGVTETLIEGETGLFFDKQTESVIVHTVKTFLNLESNFSQEKMRKVAEKFSDKTFRTQFKQIVQPLIS